LLNNSQILVGKGKFKIGLVSLEKEITKKSLDDEIYDLLLSTRKELNLREIWMETAKSKGYPRHVVQGRLTNETNFIRCAPGKFTVMENILSFKNKKDIVVKFTSEWLKSNKRPISAFLVSEVIKATDDINDLPVGLVEHILSTNNEFKKLKKGIYALS